LHSVWEKKGRDGSGGGGYVYVDKERDVLYFGGWGLDHWVLLKALKSSITPYHKDDEIARQQFMVQLRGCRSVAFDFNTCPIHSFSTQQVMDWLETFRDMRRMVVAFDLEDRKLGWGFEFPRLKLSFWLGRERRGWPGQKSFGCIRLDGIGLLLEEAQVLVI
jgi:hypothetical protein